jgi:hypothetical protein
MTAMAETSVYCIPSELHAGDTLTWRRSLVEYPASAGWQLAYTLVGSAAVVTFVAAAEGDDHVVNVPATTSAGYAPGDYTAQEFVTRAGERFTVAQYRIRILADMASATAPVDTRSHAQKVLDSINAWLESKAPVAGEVQLGDRRIRNYGIDELLKIRDRYVAEVNREQRCSQGGSDIRNVLVRL